MELRGAVLVSLLVLVSHEASGLLRPWTYTCDQYDRCIRVAPSGDDKATTTSEAVCKLTCGDSALFWPLPTNIKVLNKNIGSFDPAQVIWKNEDYYSDVNASLMIARHIKEQNDWLLLKDVNSEFDSSGTYASVEIDIYFSAPSTTPMITKNTEESYELKVEEIGGVYTANITAENYFGVRHAIETLFQSMEFDDLTKEFIMLNDWWVEDAPAFTHRGLSLDTSRNFISKETILHLIDGLSASKMNVLHWHITDTHSFPIEATSAGLEGLHIYGAYSEDQIYTRGDVREIVEHANYRGVRIVPEFDQPAHVGHGWNQPGWENYTVCMDREPWYDYCVEPPCGQLNPGKQEIYDVLEGIYSDWYKYFSYDTFHMGADEINFNCWNTSDPVLDWMASAGLGDRTEESFIEMWSQFQTNSSARLKKIHPTPNELDIIVWTSHLTLPQYIEELPKSQYIVHIWTDATDENDPTIKNLADQGYRMIFSNVDSTYMDCGFGAWVGEGNNWCSPYKGWQLQYENNPYKILEDKGVQDLEGAKELVLGGEVAMWSEQTDDNSVEGKIFPRASSYAERLWSNPTTGWYQAEPRMLHHRQRLVQRGVKADRLQPEWCRRNGGQCYGTADDPNAKPPMETTTPETTTASEAPRTTTGGSSRGTSVALTAVLATTLLNLLALTWWHY